jgi:hypothetical protein
MSGLYQEAGVEPALNELLADPIVQLFLRRDRIEVRDLIEYLDEARKGLENCGDGICSRIDAAPHDEFQT